MNFDLSWGRGGLQRFRCCAGFFSNLLQEWLMHSGLVLISWFFRQRFPTVMFSPFVEDLSQCGSLESCGLGNSFVIPYKQMNMNQYFVCALEFSLLILTQAEPFRKILLISWFWRSGGHNVLFIFVNSWPSYTDNLCNNTLWFENSFWYWLWLYLIVIYVLFEVFVITRKDRKKSVWGKYLFSALVFHSFAHLHYKTRYIRQVN